MKAFILYLSLMALTASGSNIETPCEAINQNKLKIVKQVKAKNAKMKSAATIQ